MAPANRMPLKKIGLCSLLVIELTECNAIAYKVMAKTVPKANPNKYKNLSKVD